MSYQKYIEALVGLAILPAHYERDQKWAIKGYSTAAHRYTLLSPNRLTVNINNSGYALTAQTEIDLSSAASWDSASPDYTVAAARAGLNVYIYACQQAGTIPKLLLSANSTVPTGYDANNSRKVGGFHCLCASVGTISGHTLTGFLTGDILPASVWDLRHKPREASPEGMVYVDQIGKWVDIYLASGTGANTASAHGATISDSRDWLSFVDDGAAVKKRLLKDAEFQMAAAGGNEATNIYGSQDPIVAGKCAPFLFTGSGLNDFSVNRTSFVHANEAQEYEIEVDGTGSPNTFKWRQRNFAGSWGGYTSTVAITGAFQTLADGFQIKFTATTGHTLGNKWNCYVMDGMRDTANRRMISNFGIEGMAGAMYQWLDEQSYRFDPDGSVSAAAKTGTITHVASPGGNPLYIKFISDGTPYLCCNMATDAVDKIVTLGLTYKVQITHDANAATGGLQVYFDEDATQPGRLLCNNTRLGVNCFVATNNPSYVLQITHSATASALGVAVTYDDATDERLEFTSPTTTNGTLDLALVSNAAWAWYSLPGGKGQMYRQGTYGDVKLLAGVNWYNGTNCGSRGRAASNSRWTTPASLGGRFAAEPL